MLKEFEVTNFKNFREKLSLDLSKTNSYGFNPECVKDGVVNKSLIYGYNGMGKSNLGFAIFDLISHLTDKNSSSRNYTNYLNAYKPDDIAEFRYVFSVEHGEVVYEYGKLDLETLVYERLLINGQEFASVDRRTSAIAKINAVGAENLKTDMGTSTISLVSYIKKNSILENTDTNQCFVEFIEFVNGMLFFRSLDNNNYIGLEQGSSSIGADIVDKGHLEDFERFLNASGIECKLALLGDGDENKIGFDFDGRLIPFFEIASQGTKSLSLFYFWLQRLKGNDSPVTFLFIDEFDAFYHHNLSTLIVDMLRDIKAQVIITTHNTSVMTNDLLRPDCYFLMKNNNITSLAGSTTKELREAHNIEKMYKAGSFSG